MGYNVSPESWFTKIKHSLVSKVVVLGFIVLLLMIPYFMVKGLRLEREKRSMDAEREVSGKWGRAQMVIAPILEIPLYRTAQKEKNVTVNSELFVAPNMLKVESSITPEVRNRGIYSITLYKADIKIDGYFIRRKYEDDLWKLQTKKDPKIYICLTDLKGLENMQIKINGKDVMPVANAIITAPVKMSDFPKDGKLSFSIHLKLKGCRSLLFCPIGKNFEMSMTSPWPHPSFTGGFLPQMREVSAKGFKAEWSINELNTSIPATWAGTLTRDLPDFSDKTGLMFMNKNNSFPDKSVGVTLVQPAGTYQQVDRANNYAFLVIAIVLVAFLIGESVTKIWIHPLQYFFAGLSLIMFYLLLLALAEHISFNWSYLISTIVIAGLTTSYCRMIFAKKKSAALLLGGIMCLAYLLIFVLIRLEDYALLAGSGILLVLLAILMWVTGNMNKLEEENK